MISDVMFFSTVWTVSDFTTAIKAYVVWTVIGCVFGFIRGFKQEIA